MVDADDIARLLEHHMKNWASLSERIHAQMYSAQRVSEQFLRAIESTQVDLSAFERVANQIAADQERLWATAKSISIPVIELPDFSKVTAVIADFDRRLQQSIYPAFDRLQRSLQELPPRTREALLLLGQHGWFFDLEMPFPDLWDLHKALLDGNSEEAEKWLCDYFESRLPEIEKSVCEKYPDRSKILKAAFVAHRRKEYELSVPVLLAQTDGICKEAADQYLFLKFKKKPRTALFVERVAAGSLKAALLSPLAEPLPIAASEGQRNPNDTALNRHMVLHGESVDYGSRVNSLRAISLLNYVVQVLEDGNP